MFKKILVPTDGSAQARKAAEVAADLAKSQGASVVGVFVVDPFPFAGVGETAPASLQAYMTDAQTAAAQVLAETRQICESRGVSFSGDTIERDAAYDGILVTAKVEGCDLIVMGSHGRKGIEALILGSVTQKVLTHATVPVMIIKG